MVDVAIGPGRVGDGAGPFRTAACMWAEQFGMAGNKVVNNVARVSVNAGETSPPSLQASRSGGSIVPRVGKPQSHLLEVGGPFGNLIQNPRRVFSTKHFVDITSDFVYPAFVMSKPTLPRPTDAELAILRVLWRRGPSTVRQVLEELGGETGYTTVLKLMQIMTEKGLVTRDESERTHVYEARLPEEETQKQLVTDLLERAFSGSATKLVMQALSARKASAKELAQIRALLDEMGGKR